MTRATEQPGCTVWLTGLPAAGKTSVAASLYYELGRLGRRAQHLDGDELRAGISKDLGFSPADRDENVRRAATLATAHALKGDIALVSLVSPSREHRAAARALHHKAGLSFLEVWVDAPLWLCEARDPKDLYRRARLGTLPDLTGVGAPYDAPLSPELHLDMQQSRPEQAAQVLLERLIGDGYVRIPERR